MDEIHLNGVEVLCVIGDLPEERTREQRLVVDVVLELDLAAVAASDAIADTVDYAALSQKIRAALKTAKCRLIERAAALVCAACLEEPRVRRATATVTKSGCVPGLAAAAARLTRGLPSKAPTA